MKTKTSRIRDKIRETVLSSEDGTLTEEKLAQMFNSSRTPVREALKALEQERLIETRRKKGITRRKFTRKEIIDIYETREILERRAVRVAAEKAIDSDIKELEDLNAKYFSLRQKGDKDAAEAADSEIHNKILKIFGNDFIFDFFQKVQLINKSFELKRFFPSTDYVFRPDIHNDIITAVKERDPVKAEEAMRVHISDARDSTLKAIESAEKMIQNGVWWKSEKQN
jgi:DNA-binding GntR family transcriptional regulator